MAGAGRAGCDLTADRLDPSTWHPMYEAVASALQEGQGARLLRVPLGIDMWEAIERIAQHLEAAGIGPKDESGSHPD